MIGAGTCNACLTPNYDVGFGHLRLQRALKVGSRGPSSMFALDGAAGEPRASLAAARRSRASAFAWWAATTAW
jgi:hypothetical protein